MPRIPLKSDSPTRYIPDGYELTQEAKDRLQLLDECVDRNTRRALLKKFKALPIRTFQLKAERDE